MPQFYVPRANIKGAGFAFDRQESHHLLKVLRKKVGDRIQIFDGVSLVSEAKITDVSNPSAVRGEILDSLIIKTEIPKFTLHIYPALIKSDRFEWLLEKTAELGVSSIHPTVTSRTVIQLKGKDISKKLARWKSILLAAAKQCGRTEIPEVTKPVPFKDMMKKIDKKNLNLILWEGEQKNYLSHAIQKNLPPGTRINLFFGPEGGLAIEEANLAEFAGVIPVRLGENILRAETAVLAAVSRILYA